MKTDPKHPARAQAAFTRLDLVAVLLALALCAAVVLPALAASRPRSHRVACVNNLRQIGGALQLWGNDHGDKLPFEVSYWEGGTMFIGGSNGGGGDPRLAALALNVWFHFSWLSNELNSAAILLCPSDTGRPARDFSGDPNGGYIHPNFANAATSYTLGHYSLDNPLTFVSTDRNVGFDSSTSCTLLTQVRVIANPGFPSSTVNWTAGLHNFSGNLLRRDGTVEQLGTSDFNRAIGLSPTGQGNASAHYITPR